MGRVRKDQDRLTLTALAAAIGVSEKRARKLVVRYAHMARPEGSPPTYNPRFPDLYRASRNTPHQPVEPAHRDWLARYRQEHHR